MIYFLEDDHSIRRFVLYALESVGLKAKGFGHPTEFWSALEQEKPKLLLLDIMLPDEDGLQILSKIRSNPKTAALPVIMLTAKGSEYDKVLGLDAGADDYIAKPFGTMELVSRIKAVLRRADTEAPVEEHRVGDLVINEARHTVKVGAQDVLLTLKEFELLCLLIKNKGQVFTREQISTAVWGVALDKESRTVDVHIKTLRAKLGTAAELIETVRGIGYRIGE